MSVSPPCFLLLLPPTPPPELSTLSLHDALPIFFGTLARVHRIELGIGDRRLLLVDIGGGSVGEDRKSTRLNSSHVAISYAVFCLKKKRKVRNQERSITRDLARDCTNDSSFVHSS